MTRSSRSAQTADDIDLATLGHALWRAKRWILGLTLLAGAITFIGLSMIAILFSIVNICLHFVNDFVLLMKATELVAWSLYNSMFSVSVYKILVVFLLPVLMRFVEVEKEALHNNKKLWTQG